VHDNGPGIPQERRSSLFDAMTTTKQGGSGLGLFSARTCVHGLGGMLEVAVSPLGGALLRVRLPRHPTPV
jgi:nitrogen-specific signal transduction histidine kinase